MIANRYGGKMDGGNSRELKEARRGGVELRWNTHEPSPRLCRSSGEALQGGSQPERADPRRGAPQATAHPWRQPLKSAPPLPCVCEVCVQGWCKAFGVQPLLPAPNATEAAPRLLRSAVIPAVPSGRPGARRRCAGVWRAAAPVATGALAPMPGEITGQPISDE